jgi:hypothetical protein
MSDNQIDPNQNLPLPTEADLNRDGVISIEEADLYRQHVVHYFDSQMNRDIFNLGEEDKIRFFQMVEQYADIFAKIFHKGIPIVEHILYGDEFYSAKADPHDGIDWTPSWMVKEYIEWKEKSNS